MGAIGAWIYYGVEGRKHTGNGVIQRHLYLLWLAATLSVKIKPAGHFDSVSSMGYVLGFCWCFCWNNLHFDDCPMNDEVVHVCLPQWPPASGVLSAVIIVTLIALVSRYAVGQGRGRGCWILLGYPYGTNCQPMVRHMIATLQHQRLDECMPVLPADLFWSFFGKHSNAIQCANMGSCCFLVNNQRNLYGFPLFSSGTVMLRMCFIHAPTFGWVAPRWLQRKPRSWRGVKP